MNNGRIRIITIAVITAILALVLRLAYIQLFRGSKLAEAASAQRLINSKVEKPRGNILDRNDIPFTNRDIRVSVILKPFLLKGKEAEVEKISSILGLKYTSLKRELEYEKQPIVLEATENQKALVKDLGVQGVSILNQLERYGDDSVARHVLGYLSKADQIGKTGIEAFYEQMLGYDSLNKVGVVTDARRNPVWGLGYRLMAKDGAGKKYNVKLTLDYHVQKVVEDAMEKNNVTGAVVGEDVYSGDIVAMASKPDYNQNEVENYLSSPKNELFNRAVASYNAGSIFKIIDLAVMLEQNKEPIQSIYCPGYIKVGDKEIRCSSYERGGHGLIGINEAFALSCNTYFIEMGIKLGYKNIISMASKFGLGNITGIKEQGVDESSGNLPAISGLFTDGDTANVSIGQGGIMITPVQAADIVATVANGGIKNKVGIALSIVDGKGNTIKELRKKEGTRIISKSTADNIKEFMGEVTIKGTGTKANLDKYGGAGGKTGSAETGQYINGKKVVHAWFVGYFPQKSPRYSVAVFVENGERGGDTAAPIFAEIAEEIMKQGY